MKRIIITCFTLVTCLFVGNTVYAGGGCVADTSCAQELIGSACPGTLPGATAATPYSESVTLYLPATVSIQGFTAAVDNAEITVSGLPNGLDVVFDNGTGNYDPEPNDQYFCFAVTGTPCDVGGTYEMEISIMYSLSALGFPIDLPLTLEPIELSLTSSIPELTINSASGFLCPTGAGSDLDLTAASGFSSYEWSTGDTTPTINVDASDTYSITATFSNGCELEEEIVIGDLDASVTSDATICENQVLQLVAQGGDNFAWSPSTGLYTDDEDSVAVYQLANSTTYTVTVSNSNCSDSASVAVTVDTTCDKECDNVCVPDAGLCSGLTTPQLCGPIPAADAGVSYSESVSIFIPEVVETDQVIPIPLPPDFQGVVPDEVRILSATISVDGLPSGFTWECDQFGSDCTYYPGLEPDITQYGCITICGNTCEVGDFEDLITINLEADLPQEIIDLAGLVIDGFDGTFPLDITSSLTVNADQILELDATAALIDTAAGQSSTITATGGFTSYNWSTGATDSSITVTTPGTYSVTATDANGCTQEESFTVENFLSIEDYETTATTFTVYPNPNKGIFNVSFESDVHDDVTLEVVDLQGSVHHSEVISIGVGSNTHHVNTSQLSAGIYLVRMYAETNVVTRKLTVY